MQNAVVTHRRTRDPRRTFRSEQTSGSLKGHKRAQVNKRSKINRDFLSAKAEVQAGTAPNQNTDLHPEEKGANENELR